MLHFRLLVPADLSAVVLALLSGYPAVADISVVKGAALEPAGDLVEAEVARETADELIARLKALGLLTSGALSVSSVDLSLSVSSTRAQAEAPGNSADSVIWAQVEARTGSESALSGTFLAFLTIAALLAGIGIVRDSPITVVGAMVVGPEFGPLAAMSVGLVRRRPVLVRRGAIALAVGFPLAMLVTAGAAWVGERTGLISASDLVSNRQTEFIYEPGVLSLVVALLAGAAGMLSTISGKSAALVGVFISVTTVPAAGYAAVAMVLGEWSQVGGSALQLLINLVGIVLAGVATLMIVRWIDVYRASRREPAG